MRERVRQDGATRDRFGAVAAGGVTMLRRLLWKLRPRDRSVREWEWYARDHQRSGASRHLGEEWNVPAVIGLSSEKADVVSYIEKTVIEPCIGSVGTLLEIGAGGGRFTEALTRHAQRVIAADTAPTMVRLLADRFAQRSSVVPLLLSGCSLDAIPDDSVDAVFSYDVFVHLSPWTTYAYLEEFRRVLKPGGVAVLHHANTFSELGWKRFLRDLARARALLSPQARFAPMTPDLMVRFAMRAGLVVTDLMTTVIPRDCISVLMRPR